MSTSFFEPLHTSSKTVPFSEIYLQEQAFQSKEKTLYYRSFVVQFCPTPHFIILSFILTVSGRICTRQIPFFLITVWLVKRGRMTWQFMKMIIATENKKVTWSWQWNLVSNWLPSNKFHLRLLVASWSLWDGHRNHRNQEKKIDI